MNRRNFLFLSVGYFLILFNYPLVRASSTTFFVEAYGAKASPQGWLVAVLMLVVAVWSSNRLQTRLGFHRTFVIVSCVSAMIFTISYWAYQQGLKPGAFVLFSRKEAVSYTHLTLPTIYSV